MNSYSIRKICRSSFQFSGMKVFNVVSFIHTSPKIKPFKLKRTMGKETQSLFVQLLQWSHSFFVEGSMKNEFFEILPYKKRSLKIQIFISWIGYSLRDASHNSITFCVMRGSTFHDLNFQERFLCWDLHRYCLQRWRIYSAFSNHVMQQLASLLLSVTR